LKIELWDRDIDLTKMVNVAFPEQPKQRDNVVTFLKNHTPVALPLVKIIGKFV
jgi:hypothetical protein